MKKFFEKAKLDYRFKKAGEGHTLQGDEGKATRQPSTSQTSSARAVPGSDAQRAGLAALERLSEQGKNMKRRPQSATATWKHSGSNAEQQRTTCGTGVNMEQLRKEVRQQMFIEDSAKQRKLSNNSVLPDTEQAGVDDSSVVGHEGVYFTCPFCPVSVLESEMDAHMNQCLNKLHTANPLPASCSMLYCLNKDKEKVKACVDLLCRYLDNICKNPGEEKFQRIKQSNKIFKERVAPMKGAREFLLSAGFEEKVLPVDDSEEAFFVMPSQICSDTEQVEVVKGVLISTENVKPTLDRCLKVYKPSANVAQFDVPSDFFVKTADEVKREQLARTEEVERNCQLRTRAMRDAEKRPAKNYRFTLVRIRFPDEIILQGTFHSREKLRDVFEFVRQTLVSDWQPFLLSESTGQLTNEDATLTDLGLVPAAVVNFKWDPSVMRDIIATQGSVLENVFLKDEFLQRVQELS